MNQSTNATTEEVFKTTVEVVVEPTVVGKEISEATTTEIKRLIINPTGAAITTRIIRNTRKGLLSKLISLHFAIPDKKIKNTWLDCGFNNNFMWDRSVFITYKAFLRTKVQTFDGMFDIIGEGDVKFKFGNDVLIIK